MNNIKISCFHLRGIGWTEFWQTYCKDKHSDIGIIVKSPTGHRTHIGQMSIYPTQFKKEKQNKLLFYINRPFYSYSLYPPIYPVCACTHVQRLCMYTHTDHTDSQLSKGGPKGREERSTFPQPCGAWTPVATLLFAASEPPTAPSPDGLGPDLILVSSGELNGRFHVEKGLQALLTMWSRTKAYI